MDGRPSEPGLDLAKVLWYYKLVPSSQAPDADKIVCPFHEDINPSLSANYETGRWHCFGCETGGDALAFVQRFEEKYNRLRPLQAAIRFQEILKSERTSEVVLARREGRPRKQDVDSLDEAWNYFYGLRRVNWREPELPEEQEAKEYMAERGFGPRSLSAANAKANFNLQYGLIFPMMDDGTFRGWVCRTMDPEVAKRRKYLYNKGFSRATTLVGNYKGYDHVYVVEGYMDWLRFREFGIKNVVAVLGWKVTSEQVRKLKEGGVTKVVSVLDNDACGKKGTAYLKQFFEVVRFRYLKGVKDPGEMNREQFAKMLEQTKIKIGGNTNGFN